MRNFVPFVVCLSKLLIKRADSGWFEWLLLWLSRMPIAPLKNIYLPRQRVIGAAFSPSLAKPWAVSMTALAGAGGGGAAVAITLLSGCCHVILGHISFGLQPPLPGNDVKYLRKCESFGISYECIILICNVISMYPFDPWYTYIYTCIYICITLICEYYVNESFDLWLLYHLCVLCYIHFCFT